MEVVGDENYPIDLKIDDLFARVTEMRADIKIKMKNFPEESNEYPYLDGLQQALKLIANSTSYGVLVEINPDDNEKKIFLLIFIPIKAYKGKLKWSPATVQPESRY